MILPVPRHLEHGAVDCAMPKGVRWVVRTVPLPLQSGQTSASCRGAAGALAVSALLHPADRDLPSCGQKAASSRRCSRSREVVAAARRVGIAARAAKAAAEEARENVAQIAEVAKALKARAAEAGGGVERGVAVLVVLRALVVVREDLIGLVDLLEPLLGFLVAGVQVRVVLLGKPSVCFFDLFGARALLQAQDLIIIAFFCLKFAIVSRAAVIRPLLLPAVSSPPHERI